MRTAWTISACMLATALVTGGCTSSQVHRSDARVNAAEQFVALTIVAPTPLQHAQAGGYRLGAGDSLGQAVYENYVSIVRANPNWQYASGESTK